MTRAAGTKEPDHAAVEEGDRKLVYVVCSSLTLLTAAGIGLSIAWRRLFSLWKSEGRTPTKSRPLGFGGRILKRKIPSGATKQQPPKSPMKMFDISDYTVTVVSSARKCEEFLATKVPSLSYTGLGPIGTNSTYSNATTSKNTGSCNSSYDSNGTTKPCSDDCPLPPSSVPPPPPPTLPHYPPPTKGPVPVPPPPPPGLVMAVGMDCEWNSNSGGRKEKSPSSLPVALLQLAFPNRQCLLVRLSKIGSVPPKLAQLLADKRILKFGVEIDNDARRLFHMPGGVPVAGTVDLRYMAVRCGVREGGLKSLSKQLVGADLKKHYRITCSNWEADFLLNKQICYAASDAIVALHILLALIKLKQSAIRNRTQCSAPKRLWRALTSCFSAAKTKPDELRVSQLLFESGEELDSRGEGLLSTLKSLCSGIVDVQAKKSHQRQKELSAQDIKVSSQIKIFPSRQSPLYVSCQMFTPAGTLFAYTSFRNANFYLNKNLATILSESPFQIQLNFVPKKMPDKFYSFARQNICVVCGKSREYIRKNIVPKFYRRHFPRSVKEHNSHDILLFCVDCMHSYSRHQCTLEKQFAAEYDVPPDIGTSHLDPQLVQVKRVACVLSMWGNLLPEDRRQSFMLQVASHFNCPPGDLTLEMIQQATQIDASIRKPVTAGEMVVARAMEQGELDDLQRRWRKHFLDIMKPNYLPQLWSINHRLQQQ